VQKGHVLGDTAESDPKVTCTVAASFVAFSTVTFVFVLPLSASLSTGGGGVGVQG
jgi:hypothetical protein